MLRDLPISAKEYAFGRSKIFIRLFGSIYYNDVEDDDGDDDGSSIRTQVDKDKDKDKDEDKVKKKRPV